MKLFAFPLFPCNLARLCGSRWPGCLGARLSLLPALLLHLAGSTSRCPARFVLSRFRNCRLWGDGDAAGRNEVVVVVLVLPVKVDLSRSFAHVDSFVIRSMNDNSAVVPPGKHVGVLMVSPFAICSQSITEIARIGSS